MRVFVTGGTGFIGSAVVSELLNEGHEVIGLARSDASASALALVGAEPLRGSLDDLSILRGGAARADGVVHLAFNNVSPTNDIAAASKTELATIETIGAELEGSDKPFVVTSGALALARLGRLGTELDAGISDFPRFAAELATLDLASRGIRSSIIRLAPSVHSDQDKHGFVSRLIAIAREKGKSAYVGDGSNRWPAVHQLDVAKLYRLALEGAPAGSRLHGVGEEGIPFREIAEAVGRNLNLPSESITAEEAQAHFGFLAMFIVMDAPTSSDITQKLLNWNIEGPGLIEDIDRGHYFKS